MARRYQEHLELFQCKSVDKSAEIDNNKRQAALNTAARHVESGDRPKPHVVDRAYREVYLAEYDRLSRASLSVA